MLMIWEVVVKLLLMIRLRHHVIINIVWIAKHIINVVICHSFRTNSFSFLFFSLSFSSQMLEINYRKLEALWGLKHKTTSSGLWFEFWGYSKVGHFYFILIFSFIYDINKETVTTTVEILSLPFYAVHFPSLSLSPSFSLLSDIFIRKSFRNQENSVFLWFSESCWDPCGKFSRYSVC